MKGIPPIGAVNTARKVVTPIAEKAAVTIKSGLPKEMPLPENESKIISMLHQGTPFFKAFEEIQTTLTTKFNNFFNK